MPTWTPIGSTNLGAMANNARLLLNGWSRVVAGIPYEPRKSTAYNRPVMRPQWYGAGVVTKWLTDYADVRAESIRPSGESGTLNAYSGLAVRAQDAAASFYQVSVNNQAIFLWRFDNGTYTELGYAQESVSETYSIEAVGTGLTALLGSTPRIEVTDASYASGKVGLNNGTNDGYSDIFDADFYFAESAPPATFRPRFRALPFPIGV